MYYDPSGHKQTDCTEGSNKKQDETPGERAGADGSGTGTSPNPNGKKGSQPHQDTINSIQPSNGGEMNYERKFDTPDGNKSRRFADAVEVVNGEVVSIHQAGRVNKNGTPVIREVRAMADIMSSPDYNGAPIYFWPYNSDSGPIIFGYEY